MAVIISGESEDWEKKGYCRGLKLTLNVGFLSNFGTDA